MKKLIVIAALVAVAVYNKDKVVDLAASLSGTAYDMKAKTRVEAMLNGWQKGGTGVSTDAQTAICQWAKGVSYIGDRDELGAASDQFDRWRRNHDLYRQIGSYKVLEAKIVEEKKPDRVARVSCLIDGAQYDLIVPDRQPIQWAN